jgi:asparagine synthase (glutamine-hydrolysing)
MLGHRRLSILDLSDSGAQPMTNETRTVWITFNGEIYNYQELRAVLQEAGHIFASRSDTEVIIHGYEEWGIGGLVERLAGMFAFALYDAAQAARNGDEPFAYLVRDRLGIKPLYYMSMRGALVFASEVNALRKVFPELSTPDRQGLIGFLGLGSIPSPLTYLKRVTCLAPGHYLSISRRSARLTRYWTLPVENESHGSDASMSELLRETVSAHLVADVPVGVFLSGGMDSAGIAALSAQAHPAVRTVTVTFPEREYNEGPQARRFASRYETQHQEYPVTDNDFVRSLPEILGAVDQPTADGVNTYFVSKAAAEMGLKVVLSGLGGDEVFYGYSHYRRIALATGAFGWFSRLPAAMQGVAGSGMAQYGRLFGTDRWERFAYFGQGDPVRNLYLLVRGFFPKRQIQELLDVSSGEVNDGIEAAFTTLPWGGERLHSVADRFNRLELCRYLHDQLLRDSDVFSMAHSLELRVPYLDHHVVERCALIAPQHKVHPRRNKPVLASAVGDAALSAAAAERKRGFTFPFSQWMLRHAGQLEERATASTLLQRAAIQRCWRDFRAGRVHWSRAWATTVLAHVTSSRQ